MVPTAERAPTETVGLDRGLPLERVLIVDDHPFFADGLASILHKEGLVQACAKTDTVAAALTDLIAHPGTSLVLLDLALQGEGGLALLESMASQGLGNSVVVISSNEDEAVIRMARSVGAEGYMPKSAGRQVLVSLIEAISRGERFYPSLPRDQPELCYLTPRQREVLLLIAEGLPNKKICQMLDLTEHTVKSHLKAIFTQLGVHNRTECVAQARALGLL